MVSQKKLKASYFEGGLNVQYWREINLLYLADMVDVGKTLMSVLNIEWSDGDSYDVFYMYDNNNEIYCLPS